MISILFVLLAAGTPSIFAADTKTPPAKQQKRAPSGANEYGDQGDLIPRHIRENIFEKSGLRPDVAMMDELDRDLLVMAIWKKDLARLARKYPQISPAKLKEAQRLAREAMK